MDGWKSENTNITFNPCLRLLLRACQLRYTSPVTLANSIMIYLNVPQINHKLPVFSKISCFSSGCFYCVCHCKGLFWHLNSRGFEQDRGGKSCDCPSCLKYLHYFSYLQILKHCDFSSKASNKKDSRNSSPHDSAQNLLKWGVKRGLCKDRGYKNKYKYWSTVTSPQRPQLTPLYQGGRVATALLVCSIATFIQFMNL